MNPLPQFFDYFFVTFKKKVFRKGGRGKEKVGGWEGCIELRFFLFLEKEKEQLERQSSSTLPTTPLRVFFPLFGVNQNQRNEKKREKREKVKGGERE